MAYSYRVYVGVNIGVNIKYIKKKTTSGWSFFAGEVITLEHINTIQLESMWSQILNGEDIGLFFTYFFIALRPSN